MLTLYHYDRSTACQRVRLTLEEKGIPWESVVVDTAQGKADELPPGYHELNPKGLVPAIIHDGRAIAESLVILEYLEDVFPTPSFRPEDPYLRAVMRQWMRRIDDGIHVASRVIGVCIVNRHAYLALPRGQLDDYYARMRDPVRRKNDRLNIEKGLDSPLLPDAVAAFRSLFEEMDRALHDTGWLAGPDCSLADLALVVYLRRLASFQMAPLWESLTALNEWYDRLKARPAYVRAIEEWGDRTSEARVRHGQGAFGRIEEMWKAA